MSFEKPKPYSPYEDSSEGGLLTKEEGEEITDEFPIVTHTEELEPTRPDQSESVADEFELDHNDTDQIVLAEQEAHKEDQSRDMEKLESARVAWRDNQSRIAQQQEEVTRYEDEKRGALPVSKSVERLQSAAWVAKIGEAEKKAVFSNLRSLRNRIATMTDSVKEVEDTNEAEYEKRLAALRVEEKKKDEMIQDALRIAAIQSEIQAEIKELRQTEHDAYEEDNAREDEKKDRATSYRIEKAKVFDRIQPLEDRIKRTIESVKEVENTNEAEYEKRLSILREEEMRRDAVVSFEKKLWGETPDDFNRNGAVLLANIENCETRADLLSVFDKWSALPGEDYLSKPITDRAGVENFLQEMGTMSPEVFEARATDIFKNETLRRVVMELPKREKIQYALDASLKVVDEEPAVPYVRKQPHFEREEVENHVEKEFEALYQEEQDLTAAKSILKSKMFRFAPALMNLTKEGRDNLAILKRAKLYPKAAGSGSRNLELARSFRLKSVREREASMRGQVHTRFASNLEKREDSQYIHEFEKQFLGNDQKTEYAEEKQKLERLRNRDTREENLSRIDRSLRSQVGRKSLFQRITGLFESKKPEFSGSATFADIITPEQVTRTNVITDAPSVSAKEWNRIQREKPVETPVVDLGEALYTEAPIVEKTEKQKKKVPKITSNGKQKKRTSKRLL